jgi:hypothetical protein
VRARLVADLELKTGVVDVLWVRDVFYVAVRDGVHVLKGQSLEPLVEHVNVLGLRSGQILTPDRIISVDGGEVMLPSFDGATVATFAPVSEGAIVAVEQRNRVDAAAVYRIDPHGTVVWRTSTAPPPTISGYVSEMRREDNFAIKPARAWKPEQWNIAYCDLHVWGDRLFALYAEMPRSGIGIGYGIDVHSGSLVYTTPPAPYAEISGALDVGSFLVGIQGYGAFETRLVDRNGVVRTIWPSHGLAVIGSPTRVVELENVLPSRSHVATLLDDGTVSRGAHLPGYSTSPVLVGDDGSLVFWRENALMRVTPDNERLERILPIPLPGYPYSRAFSGSVPGRVVLHVSTNHDANGELVPSHRLLIIDVE